MWLFQWAFAATAATIVSGAVAERVTFGCYIAYSIILTAFIYPVVVHSGWSGNGWASAWREEDLLFGCGVTDFAGSGVVHLTGAVAALVAAIVVGPRIGRFEEKGLKMPQQSVIFQTLGTLILWFGWYGFNGVSTLALSGLSSVASHAMVTTTISAGAACLSTVAITYFLSPDHEISISAANNGILAGLVGITSGCATVEPVGALIIGVIASLFYVAGDAFMNKFEIDDVVGAVPVHGFCGMWGLIAPGFFSSVKMYGQGYYSDRADECAGVFYGGNGAALGAACVFILFILAWVGATATVLFIGCKYTIGVRVSKEVEEAGMDDSKHGGKVFGVATGVKESDVKYEL
jgi:Amt family ammonium transporter